MNIIVPIGGIGSRFKEWNLPKPLIIVNNKPLICWLFDNLPLDKVERIIIPYNPDQLDNQFEQLLKDRYPDTQFIFYKLEKQTGGAAETLLLMCNQLQKLSLPDFPILSLDSDAFYTTDILSKWDGKNRLILFKHNCLDPIFSYAQLTDDNKITKVIEKDVVSEYACSGAYGFESWKQLQKWCQHIIDNNITRKNEYYTTVVVDQMIQNNIKFHGVVIDKSEFVCLGTPGQIEKFLSENREFPFFFIHINKNMGTTILMQLSEQYKKKFYGLTTIEEYEKKNNVLLSHKKEIYGSEQFSIDHLSLDELLQLGILNPIDIKQIQCICIVRDPIERFISQCNFVSRSPEQYIDKVKNDEMFYSEDLRKKHSFYLNLNHNWNITMFDINNKNQIVQWFKRFNVEIDLNRFENVSEKKYTIEQLTEEQLIFFKEYYKDDFELFNKVLENRTVKL